MFFSIWGLKSQMRNGTEGNIYYLSNLCLVFEICEGSKARAIEWLFIRNPLDPKCQTFILEFL